MIALNVAITYLGGLGKSFSELSLEQITFILKILYCSIITYSLAISSVKISLLLLYRRIFDTEHFKKRSLIVGIACVLCLYAYYLGFSSSNLVLDLVILLLPLHMVWKLKLPPRQKLALSGIFSIGLLSCIAASVRALVDEYLWSLAEPATAIFCACAATYRPLFTTFDFSLMRGISSRLGRSEQGASGQSERQSDDPEKNLQYQWIAARGLRTPMTYQQMYARVTKHNPHVLNVIPNKASSSTTGKPDASRSDQSPKPQKTRWSRSKRPLVTQPWDSLERDLDRVFEHISTTPQD
ncbi:MAG: hypothetical protein Q9182_002576 [Xanthomendoza sp. 2 TL-2023]